MSDEQKDGVVEKILCVNKHGEERMITKQAIVNKWIDDYWPVNEPKTSTLNALKPANGEDEGETIGKKELKDFVNNTSDIENLEALKIKRRLPWQTVIIQKRIDELKTVQTKKD
jgi:hypothetical protein